MIFISATRLKLKSFRYLPAFFIANEASVKQLTKTPGFLGGKELIDKNFTFWTLTLWKDISDMRIFRNAEPHKKAMQKLPFWCNEASYVHWTEEAYKPVEWQTAYLKLIQEGSVSKVRNPSPQQLTKNYPTPQWSKLERTFRAYS